MRFKAFTNDYDDDDFLNDLDLDDLMMMMMILFR